MLKLSLEAKCANAQQVVNTLVGILAEIVADMNDVEVESSAIYRDGKGEFLRQYRMVIRDECDCGMGCRECMGACSPVKEYSDV